MCKVPHKFDYNFTQTQRKELFAVSLAMGQIFLDNSSEATKDHLFQEYWDFIRANKEIETQQGAIDSVDRAYKKLEAITGGEDVDVHPLLLSVNAILFLWESGYYKGSKRMKALRVANELYFKIEKHIEPAKLSRTNKLIGKLIDGYN